MGRCIAGSARPVFVGPGRGGWVGPTKGDWGKIIFLGKDLDISVSSVRERKILRTGKKKKKKKREETEDRGERTPVAPREGLFCKLKYRAIIFGAYVFYVM